MTPILKIKLNDQTVERIEVQGLKAAVKFVEEFPASDSHSFIFSTVNDKNKIENTVTIRKSQP
jgi:hypothetical protein